MMRLCVQVADLTRRLEESEAKQTATPAAVTASRDRPESAAMSVNSSLAGLRLPCIESLAVCTPSVAALEQARSLRCTGL